MSTSIDSIPSVYPKGIDAYSVYVLLLHEIMQIGQESIFLSYSYEGAE